MGKGEDQQKANSAPSSSANQFLSSNTDLCIFRPNDIEALENKLTGILSSPSCSPSSCPSTPTTAMSRATSTDLSSTRHGTTTSTESGSSFSGDEFSTVVVGLLNSTARTPTPLLVQEEKTRRFQEYRTFDLELGHRSMPGLKDPGAHQVRNPMIDISEKEAALAELKGCPPALAGFGDQHVLGVMSLNEGSAEEAFPVARVVGDGEGNGDNGKQVQEAEEIDPRKKFEKTRRAICISVLILFVLVGVLACVVALVVLPSTEDDKSRFGAAGSSTLHPEQAVSMAPTTYRESLGIQEQVEKVMGSSRIRNPTTPHHKALQWILHEDPMELLADAPNLIQRYILTLFYFQTSAERPWRSCNPPNETLLLEKGSHRCELEEIIWVHPELVFKSVPNQTRWLSYEHECEWVGVLCDEYDDVFDLFLEGYDLTGNLPHEIGFLPALHSISLGWNSLSGTLPASLAIVMKERAYQVVLHGNSFSGTLPVEWCQFQNVRRLGLSDNELTGTIPTEIGQLGAGPGGEEALLGLFLYGNDGLSGTVPTEIGNLGALAYARLGRTSLNGTIPTEVGRLSELQEFWVHKSSISGAIPSEFGVLSGMKDLRLQLSRITGTIPDEIYGMSQLKRLDLWQTGEGLTGTISPKIGQLAESLVTLRLQNNSFTGTLPTELALLTRLETLFIESNELEGIVPAVMCDAVLGRGSNLTDNGGGAYIVADCLPPSNNDTTNATFVDCELGCCAICCNPASQICNGITM